MRCKEKDDVDVVGADTAALPVSPILEDKTLANEEERDKAFVWLWCIEEDEGVVNAVGTTGDGVVDVADDDGKNSLFNKAIIMSTNNS